MDARLLELAQRGITGASIAQTLTAEGFRSALRHTVSVETATHMYQRLGVLRCGRRPQPRQVAGRLTIAALAAELHVSRDWIDRRIRDGTITSARDKATRRHLFPGSDTTLTRLQRMKAGEVQHLDFEQSADE